MSKAEKYIYRPTHDGVGSLVLAKKAEPKTMKGDRILYIHRGPVEELTKSGISRLGQTIRAILLQIIKNVRVT